MGFPAGGDGHVGSAVIDHIGVVLSQVSGACLRRVGRAGIQVLRQPLGVGPGVEVDGQVVGEDSLLTGVDDLLGDGLEEAYQLRRVGHVVGIAAVRNGPAPHMALLRGIQADADGVHLIAGVADIVQNLGSRSLLIRPCSVRDRRAVCQEDDDALARVLFRSRPVLQSIEGSDHSGSGGRVAVLDRPVRDLPDGRIALIPGLEVHEPLRVGVIFVEIHEGNAVVVCVVLEEDLGGPHGGDLGKGLPLGVLESVPAAHAAGAVQHEDHVRALHQGGALDRQDNLGDGRIDVHPLGGLAGGDHALGLAVDQGVAVGAGVGQGGVRIFGLDAGADGGGQIVHCRDGGLAGIAVVRAVGDLQAGGLFDLTGAETT